MNKRCLYIISSLFVCTSYAMKVAQKKSPASLQLLSAITIAQKICGNVQDQAKTFLSLHTDLRNYIKSHIVLYKNKINPIKFPQRALFCAAKYNLGNLIDELLDCGVVIDITFGDQLLGIATEFNNIEMVKKLLMLLEDKYESGVIATMLTKSDILLTAQSPEVANLLVAYGANQKKDLIAAQAIDVYVERKNPSIVKWWLPYRKYKIEHRLEDAIKQAIALRNEGKAVDEQENALEMVKVFLENGAQINWSNWQKPLLQQAQEAKYPQLVRLLRSYQNR